MIEWNSSRTYDPNCMCHVLQAMVDCQSVVVRVSEEAMDDRGEAAALAVAEKKIVAGMWDGPKEVLVINDHFLR